ncbi:hypothetical protein ACWED2_10155 [Amycolatopsis sp. NPDC005003]
MYAAGGKSARGLRWPSAASEDRNMEGSRDNLRFRGQRWPFAASEDRNRYAETLQDATRRQRWPSAASEDRNDPAARGPVDRDQRGSQH